MSLELAVRHALKNPIKSRGRTSISRFCTYITNGRSHFLGYNSYKTSPVQAKYAFKTGNPMKLHIHSEISALIRSAKMWRIGNDDPKDYRMYVARVLADGTPANARPCEGCMAAIAEFGIKEVYWTE